MLKEIKDRVVEKGKKIMKDSLNPNHNFVHANNVYNHAFEIHKELGGIDFGYVEIACWWHDAYKSKQRSNTIYAVFFEGYESSKIFKNEMRGILDESSINLISNAIFNHNIPPVLLMILGRYDSLTQILVEADNIDSLSLERYHQVHTNYPNLLLYLIIRMYKVYLDISSLGVRKSLYYINNFKIF